MANNNDAAKLKHLLVSDTARIEAYSPRGGGPRFDVPPRNRRRHASGLLQQFRGIRTDVEGIQAERARLGFDPGAGIVLQFESHRDFPLKFESLDLRSQGIELLTVRESEGTTTALCYVPDGKLDAFIRKIEAYRDETTRGGKPKHNQLVGSIETVQLAAVDALWTDDMSRMPAANARAWWEIWLRTDDEAAVHELKRAASRVGLDLTDEILHFPERTVMTANCTKRQLGRVLRLTSTIAELREAKHAAAAFMHLAPKQQYQVAQEFLADVSLNETTNTAACLLDTGVTQGHLLLEVALSQDDCHAYNGAWGTHDLEGHGTEMAGISLYGNLASAIQNGGKLELEHRLESVKILNPNDPNPPHLYGAVTIRAAELVEAANPERKRVIGMAITAQGDESGEPSTWSAAVDSLTSGYADDRRRLMLIAAGNSEPSGWHRHPESCLETSIQDPAQAWNALTIGACTQLYALPEDQYPEWKAVAVQGDVSPYSSTSSTWNPAWPIKPDVVFEGGNCAVDPNTGTATQVDELSLLTTHGEPAARTFSLLWATSAATAMASGFAATLQARYPEYWPETIRGLVVHSADWTEAMKQHFQPINTRDKRAQLLRYCGYGLPDLDRACWSASNQLTLISQDQLQPYRRENSDYKTKDISIHTLPWPVDVLRQLRDEEVELRVTLSYFIEPNPGRRGWKGRYRYASHALRFDVKTPIETGREFRGRVNSAARDDDDGDQQYAGDAVEWDIGPQLRHRGSIHSDRWRGTASALAERNMIAVFPVVGWWRERHHLGRWGRAARYSLIVTIRTPTEETDIYTPVANEVGVQIEIDIEDDNR